MSMSSREAVVFTAVATAVQAGVMAVSVAFLELVEKYKWFEDAKVPQKPLKVKQPDKKSCLQYVVFLKLFEVSGLPLVYTLLKWRGLRFEEPGPNWPEYVLEIGAFMLIEDTMTYWIHRLFHTPFLYKHFHKVHHRYHHPTGLASYYFHPVDLAVGVSVPLFTGPLLFKSHVYTLWVWIGVRMLEGVDGHCGYDLWFMPFRYFPFRPGAGVHHYHHTHSCGNYGSFFRFWDWLCGTDLKYKEYLKRHANEEL
eukprot:Em0020g93a